MRACKDFKPMVTNVDVCRFWERHVWDRYPMAGPASQYGLSRAHRDFQGDPEPLPEPRCKKGLDCPTNGQRPERLDQESDSEE